MFSGFPLLTPKLINTLQQQGFSNFVRQDWTKNYQLNQGGTRTFLYSPFKAFDKAEYYCKRLKKDLLPDFFNIKNTHQKKRLFEAAEDQQQVCLAKIIEHNFKLVDEERIRIARHVQTRYPQQYELMLKNDFRIIIGDNFGKVFYKLRIGTGVIVSINDGDL